VESCRAIQKHNPDWQKDPSASLNFPERAGEGLDSHDDPDIRRWAPAVSQWASGDMVMARNQAGAITPDCAVSRWTSTGGARSNSVGGDASTPSKAKITPFHAKVMVASHHPIPSRSHYPSGFNVHGSGSDSDGSPQSQSTRGLSMRCGGKGEMARPVSKLLDLRDLVEACSAHASVCSSPMPGHTVKKEESGDKFSGEARVGSDEAADTGSMRSTKLSSPTHV
jgi:hypothetical protein